MKYLIITIVISILLVSNSYAQDTTRVKSSVFTKIINRELPAKIVYEDDELIAFFPLRLQAPVHLLIVPKKQIATINDLEEEDALLMGKMFLLAKKLAIENKIADTGYRLSLNCNADAGQSVQHIHLHLNIPFLVLLLFFQHILQ